MALVKICEGKHSSDVLTQTPTYIWSSSRLSILPAAEIEQVPPCRVFAQAIATNKAFAKTLSPKLDLRMWGIDPEIE